VEVNLSKINSNITILNILKYHGIRTRGAKKWLIDTDYEIVGVLQQNDIAYIFSPQELKLLEENKHKSKRLTAKELKDRQEQIKKDRLNLKSKNNAREKARLARLSKAKSKNANK